MLKSRLEQLITYSRGSTRRHVHDLRAGQWLDPSASRADQDRRLSALLQHAAQHVPYYRETLAQAGVCESPGRVLVGRFAQVPLLDKATVRARFDELKSDDLSMRKWDYDSTGGSTGEPVRLVHDEGYRDWQRAISIVANGIACRRSDERKLYLWGSVHDLTGQETPRARLGQWMRNEVWLNSFRMTPGFMHSCVELVNQSRPDHIIGYVESIVELARFIERNGLEVHSPKTVATAAGSLQPHMRELIQGVFRAGVFNQYGSREVTGMAVECERHEGMHVPLQSVLIEVLRDDGTPAEPGETGHIVVTSLINYAMPLIRYDIGDLGAWAEAPCSCGRVWPLLRSITGRISDTFVTADGTLVAGEYFNYVFYLQDWVEKFQVVQESTRRIRARIVRRKDMPEAGGAEAAGLEEIVQKVRLALGADCSVSFEFVDDIEPSASGKYRFTVSNVHERDQART
jgi:phenylacetate-CoA ligase